MVGEIEMSNHEGYCRFCGTGMPILAVDQTDADLKVSEICDCGGSEKEKRHVSMIDNIDAMFGQGCDSSFFKPVSEKQMRLIMAAGESVFNGEVASVSIGLGKTSAKISLTSKDNVKVERSFGTKIQMES